MGMAAHSLNMSLKAYVGANARKWRDRLGITQEEMALRVGVSPRYYRAIELGAVNLTLLTLALLANALEIPAFKLLKPAQIKKRGPGRPKSN